MPIIKAISVVSNREVVFYFVSLKEYENKKQENKQKKPPKNTEIYKSFPAIGLPSKIMSLFFHFFPM